jgi:hypothetical protein
MKQDHAQLSERITFAEDWLARARRQLEQGETGRGNLTLLLAEAEVHHARELGMGAAPARPPLPRAYAAIGMLTVAALAATIWASGLQPATSPRPVADGSTVIVTLSDGRGSLLELIQTPAVTADTKTDEDQGFAARARVARLPVKTIAMRPPVLTAAPGFVLARPPVRPEPEPAPAVAVAQAPPSPPAPADTSAAAQPSAPPLISEANLIDLVLAAERSLRRANQ